LGNSKLCVIIQLLRHVWFSLIFVAVKIFTSDVKFWTPYSETAERIDLKVLCTAYEFLLFSKT